MGKFINIPLPLLNATAAMPAAADSGTTTAAVADTLTDAGQNFVTTVTVGDIIFPAGQTPDIYSTVVAIVDDETLTISGTGNTLLEASGTVYTIFTDADAHTVVSAGNLFKNDVRVGDLVINSTAGINGKVTKVLSDTELLVDSILFTDNATDAVVIISQSGFGGRLVNLEHIVMVIPTAGGAGTTPVLLQYKTTATASDILTITVSKAQADYAWSMAFTDLMVETLQSSWTNVVAEMPMVTAPVVASENAYLYATAVTLA
tara:strand:+ start:290 stop:1072 length:783 start_codon:yes stop_codon:yes gene_type:complete